MEKKFGGDPSWGTYKTNSDIPAFVFSWEGRWCFASSVWKQISEFFCQ